MKILLISEHLRAFLGFWFKIVYLRSSLTTLAIPTVAVIVTYGLRSLLAKVHNGTAWHGALLD